MANQGPHYANYNPGIFRQAFDVLWPKADLKTREQCSALNVVKELDAESE